MEPHFGDIIQLIVDNYNDHKLEKNKPLTVDDVVVLSSRDTDKGWHLFLTTKRNDGLLYEVTQEDKTVLHLYNRIARKVITKEENA